MENVKYIPGDLVKIYGDICRVKGVRKKDNSLTPCLVEARVISDTENIVRAVDDSGIEPIPLTPQILEANGWKEVPLAKGHYVRQQGISIFKNINGEGFLAQYEIDITINLDFVHQLQHLLFGLGLSSELKI